MNEFYEPEDDSKFLLKNILNILQHNKTDLNKNNFFEVGVGSGFISLEVAKQFPQLNYYGSDINIKAIENTQKIFKDNNLKIKLRNIKFFGNNSDLDYVIFNPPYLPLDFEKSIDELKTIDKAIYGGKVGNEVIIEFIKNIYNVLNENGTVLVLVSSIGGYKQVLELLNHYHYDTKVIDKIDLFFETLYCIQFNFSSFQQELKKLNIINFDYIDNGWSSQVYTGNLNHKEIIIKKFIDDKTTHREKLFLEKLQTENFVPQLIHSTNSFIVMEKINGTLINDFISLSNKKEILIVLSKILNICFKLDEMKINKFELINPYKHIFVLDDLNIKFIDFERCIYTDKPKNVSQILEFFRRKKDILKSKDIILSEETIKQVALKYKKDFQNFEFNLLLEEL